MPHYIHDIGNGPLPGRPLPSNLRGPPSPGNRAGRTSCLGHVEPGGTIWPYGFWSFRVVFNMLSLHCPSCHSREPLGELRARVAQGDGNYGVHRMTSDPVQSSDDDMDDSIPVPRTIYGLKANECILLVALPLTSGMSPGTVPPWLWTCLLITRSSTTLCALDCGQVVQ